MGNPPDPPTPDNVSPPGASANPPASAQPTRCRRDGAGLGVLGALFILCGVFLPTYGTVDYEKAGLENAPWLIFGLLIALALFILGISAWFWFSKPPIWLVVVGTLVLILALIMDWLVSLLAAGLACFDVCPAGGVSYGTGFWLPLIGFPLGVIGSIIAATRRRPQRPTPKA